MAAKKIVAASQQLAQVGNNRRSEGHELAFSQIDGCRILVGEQANNSIPVLQHSNLIKENSSPAVHRSKDFPARKTAVSQRGKCEPARRCSRSPATGWLELLPKKAGTGRMLGANLPESRN